MICSPPVQRVSVSQFLFLEILKGPSNKEVQMQNTFKSIITLKEKRSTVYDYSIEKGYAVGSNRGILPTAKQEISL